MAGNGPRNEKPPARMSGRRQQNSTPRGAAVGVTLEPESSRWRPQGNLKALRRADMHTGCTYGLRSFAYRERDVPTGVHTRELLGSIRTISLRETRRLDERPFSRCPGPCPPGRAA